jgi:hypothetical protein
MLTKEDLWPETRSLIESELKRRAATSTPGVRTPEMRTVREEAEPLDSRLRGDEERVVPIRCPRCGHDVDCFVRLVRK